MTGHEHRDVGLDTRIRFVVRGQPVFGNTESCPEVTACLASGAGRRSSWSGASPFRGPKAYEVHDQFCDFSGRWI